MIIVNAHQEGNMAQPESRGQGAHYEPLWALTSLIIALD
jgi:hypothetical protein